MTTGTLHVLTPTYKLVGGVVKIFDYLTHALAAGYQASVWCPERHDPQAPVFGIDRFAGLAERPDVRFHSAKRLEIGPRDLVFMSLPRNIDVVDRSLPPGMSPERVIHIIQGVRHVNPGWAHGQPLRLLTRPLARISINDIVAETIRPWLDPRATHEVIPLAHDLDHFARQRSGPFSPRLRVAYTTWKSDLGDRTAQLLGDAYEFRAVRDAVGWSELRDLYHWADVFLSTPSREEGLYLPGIEAMSAGCVVVTPDAGGNMSYCLPGENCVLVPFDDAGAYAQAVRDIAGWPQDQIERVRAAGHAATAPFDLAVERTSFSNYLDRLWSRIERDEQG